MRKYRLLAVATLLIAVLAGCGKEDKKPPLEGTPTAVPIGVSPETTKEPAATKPMVQPVENQPTAPVSPEPTKEGQGGQPTDSEPTKAPEPTNVPTPFVFQVTETPAKKMVTVAEVYARSMPSTEAPIYEMFTIGREVVVNGKSGEWYRIDYDGRDAFLFALYVGEKPAESEIAPPRSGAAGTGIFYMKNPSAPIIAIDPGHQRYADSEKEPIGPGAGETKARVSSGTSGKWTGLPEYELNLMVSMQLKDVLLEEGYNVFMIRETNDVSISNAERATLANNIGADLFIRVHANGVDNAAVSGMTVLCPSPKNSFCSESVIQKSKALSQAVLNHMVEETGAKNRGVSENDTMSGINWCKVPVTIVEMGFMTNEREDKLLQTTEYQKKIVKGMVEGIREYLGK